MTENKPRKLKVPNGRSVKARGRNWENAVVTALRAIGFTKAERNGAVYGSQDRGDIGNVPLTVQCKAVDRVQMWTHLDQAIEQAEHNSTSDETVVIYKRHNTTTENAAVVMPLSFALRLIEVYYGKYEE